MSRLTASTRARRAGGNSRSSEPRSVVGLDQQVERQDQDRQEAEQPADDAGERAEDGGHRVAALAHRRPRHRLLDRQRLARAGLSATRNSCARSNISRQRAPQLLRLVNERRHDQEPDADQRADDEQVEDEDRQPARKAPRADRAGTAGARSSRTIGLKPDRQQPAHVDQQQDVADEDTRAQRATTASAAIQIVQRLSAFWSETADTALRSPAGEERRREAADVVVDRSRAPPGEARNTIRKKPSSGLAPKPEP